MSEQKKPAVETQSRSSQELDERELDGITGGMGVQVGFSFTFGHTVYEGSVGVNSSAPFYVTGSLRGVASR